VENRLGDLGERKKGGTGHQEKKKREGSPDDAAPVQASSSPFEIKGKRAKALFPFPVKRGGGGVIASRKGSPFPS